jgi:dipeptidyl-peptidase-4
VTRDGQRNKIINGNCDWVYEEEFEFTRAYEWAPDSRTIAYYKFDESRVPEYTMTIYDGLYPTPYKYKYPKAGEDNSLVNILWYNV